MSKVNSTTIVKNLIILLALIESFLLMLTSRQMRSGLDECIWLLPLTLALCFALRGNTFEYHKNGIALKVYYCIVVVRYLVLPFTIYLSHGETGRYMPSVKTPVSYWVSIIIMCMELIISVHIISKYYTIYLIKESRNATDVKKYHSNSITTGGWVIVGVLACILIARANYVIPSVNIILIKDAAEESGVWYEAIIVNCLKAFAFAMLMQAIYKKKGTGVRTSYYVLAVVFALANFGIYFGSNRAYIVMTLIATIYVYMYIYPEYKTVSTIALIPVGIICVFTMFVNKQFGVEVTDFSTSVLSAKSISNIIELYVGGPWNYASGFEATFGRWLPDIGMIIASYIQKFALTNIPGFKWLHIIENSCTSLYGTDVYAWDAYQKTLGIFGNSQILSGVMEIVVMFGHLVGWILSFGYQVWVSKMVVKIECRAKVLDDIGYKYLYAWLGVMFGMYMCYSPALMLWIWSKFVLFYWLLLKFNDKIRIGKERGI